MNAAQSLPTVEELRRQWRDGPRWRGIRRSYDAKDVARLRGTVAVEHSIARLTADKLWRYLSEQPFVNALGALTGNQAMQQVKALEQQRQKGAVTALQDSSRPVEDLPKTTP